MLKMLIILTILMTSLGITCFAFPGASFGGFFFIALAIYFVLLYFCEKKVRSRYYNGKILKYFVFFLKFMFILWLISFIIIEGLIANGKKDDDISADTIIVLGAGVNYDKPSYSFKLRLDTALDYLLENPEAMVITTGGHSPEDLYSEGQVGKNYLVQKGISENRIIVEEKSKNTEQNIEFAKECLGDFSGKTAVISNGFHLYRARSIMEQNGLDPYGYGSNLGESYPFLEIIYNIREYFSVIKHYILK